MKEIEFDWPILGQDRIKKFLKRSISTQSFTHAYLFLGPEKIGKTKAAKLIGKSLLCENYNKFQQNLVDTKVTVPCNQCTHCQQFDKGIHPDVYFLEREQKEGGDELKTQISVTQIRDLQSRINKRAFLNSYKIVIVPQADFLTEEASNSLLKTLEEPTQKTVLILIAQNKQSLLDTIISRCQLLFFSIVGREEVYDYLVNQGANRDQAKIFSKLGQGRPTRAMKLFSNIDQFNELKEDQIKFIEILKSNLADRFLYINSIANEKRDDLLKKIDEWIMLLRDLLLIEVGNKNEVSNVHLIENINEVSNKFSKEKVKSLISDLERAKISINKNINIKLTLENFFLKI